ncbi:MAG: M1 family metallopeptidase [Gemmatimonadetes bacterium]|nr:M1 family metallopeptidase [Gemmatimonadota bacterium]
MRSLSLSAALLLAAAAPLVAQSGLAVADSSPFRPLNLPAPNEYRGGSGRPGPRYWQQRVDYRIRATLDPVANEISGRETIHYVNHSPDALPYLWLFVEQNICDPASVTNLLNQPPLVFLGSTFDFSCQGFAGGGRLETMTLRGKEVNRSRSGTTMRVELPKPLAPGDSLDLEAVWRFKVPTQGAGRMGHDGALYEIAQWYPRMVVYDDVRGWNHEPYIGAGEFYLEYGNFDVSLTVPATHLVAATGDLLNPLQVLTATQRARLALARRSDTAIAIVTRTEAGNPAATRPTAQGTLTWRFSAKNVRDFAFVSGPDFRWDASGYDGILIETLYRPRAEAWTEANRMSREAIKHFSEKWYRYPWSHATTVEGPIEGMEYPMLTFVPNSPTREELQGPGARVRAPVVPDDRRLERATLPLDGRGLQHLHRPRQQRQLLPRHRVWRLDRGPPAASGRTPHDAGGGAAADHQATSVRDLFWTGYQKPALMLSLLRDEVLGRERFEAAFREYIRAWAFKHPTPTDFFRIMRDASGMELDWFWRDWVYTTARLDQAVDSITARPDGGSNVHLSNRGTMTMPAELALTFSDGTTSTVRLPVEMWNLGQRFTYRVPGTKRVTRATIDPRGAMPDTDRSNNTRGAP